MSEFNQTVISTIGGMITGIAISFIGLFATRKKGIADAESRATDEWRELYEAMKVRVIRLEKKLDKMEKELFEVKCDRNKLLDDITKLKRTVNGEVEE